MTSELRSDIADVDDVFNASSVRHDWPAALAAWQRIRARLTPDREKVAIAICEAFTTPKGVLWWATDEETREKFRREADAAIDAMGETP